MSVWQDAKSGACVWGAEQPYLQKGGWGLCNLITNETLGDSCAVTGILTNVTKNGHCMLFGFLCLKQSRQRRILSGGEPFRLIEMTG
jgi:hypothetical protein